MTTEHDHNGPDRRAPVQQGWHLKKEVNLSIIITVIGTVVAGLTAYSDLKKDIELIKADAIVLHQRDTQQQTDMREAMTQVRDQFNSLNAKLDRLIERSAK